MPSAPGAPSIPSAPGAPSMPSAPGAPSMPSAPGAPSMPSVPGEPSMPSVPGVPSEPLQTVVLPETSSSPSWLSWLASTPNSISEPPVAHVSPASIGVVRKRVVWPSVPFWPSAPSAPPQAVQKRSASTESFWGVFFTFILVFWRFRGSWPVLRKQRGLFFAGEVRSKSTGPCVREPDLVSIYLDDSLV